MKHRIIVIDDQHSERRLGYENLAEKISAIAPGFEIELDIIEDCNSIEYKTKHTCYSAAIVDAVLNEKWPNFTITKALKALGNELPIAILSERWDNTNAEEMNEAWGKPNCRTFLHWRDIDPKTCTGQIDFAVRAFVSMLADKKKLDTQLNLGPNDPIRIVHISDIQTGGCDSSMFKLEAIRCADRILQHWEECSPTFVAFTGDVAEHGTPAQYKSAREWIAYFFERLDLNGLPARNLLYVPGNHDVNLRLATAARVQLTKTTKTNKLQMKLSNKLQENSKDLLGYALTPFRNFLAEISDCPLLTHDANDQSLAWVEARFRHFGVIFYGINTAQPVNAFGVPDRQVDANALAQIHVELKQMVKDCGDKPPLIIGLGHHCPVAADDDSAVSNLKDFEKFFRHRTKTALFLHGHIHEHDLTYTSNDSLRIVRSCATTLTKHGAARPPDSLRGFNLLELDRENHFIKSLRATSLGWVGNELKEVKAGKWVRKNDGMFKES